MYKKLKKILLKINKSKKTKCFFLGNTTKVEKSSFYISDLRENNKFIFASVIIYDDLSAKKISKIIDGKVDYILVDTEKKVLSKDKKKIVNLEKNVKATVTKSEIFTYKGNDLTVDSADTFINNYFIKDIRGVGGKKILILGSGNIGFKLALKLVESGANVFLYRRSKKILDNIIKSINYIKPKGTIAKAEKLKQISNNLNNFDAIIGTTNGKAVLTLNHIKKFAVDSILLDIGKGILKKDALEYGINNGLKFFRLDITPAYFGYLENISSTKKLSRTGVFKTMLNKEFTLAHKGILTKKNTLIVDSLNNPKKVFGVSDGFGGYKKLNLKQIKLIEKKIKI
tara:strand:+ start:2648 stop:3670 length:1023 start_codon:yes stop_codon:yes gene_type:complete